MSLMRAAVVAFGIVIAMVPATLGGQMPPQAASIPAGDSVIVGRVVDGATGAAVPTAIVTLQPGSGSGYQQSSERVLTDSQGRFFIDNIGPGSFTLRATKPGWIE